MTLEEFREEYNYAPYSKMQFIINATKVNDDKELRDKALNAWNAVEDFEKALEKRDIHYG